MPRGVKKEIVYTGKAAKAYEKVQRLEKELKDAKAELKMIYAEQIKAEKAAAKQKQKDDMDKLMKAIKGSDKSAEEIMAFISGEDTKE